MIYLAALGICIVGAAFEGLCAGRDPMAQLRQTRQPRWSPPNKVWIAIGIAWYVGCFVALVRLLPNRPRSGVAVVLLLALMAANGFANVLGFRLKRLDWAFYFFAPYWLLLGAFMVQACRIDQVTCVLFALYAAYQLYAVVWAFSLWRMNPRRP